MGIDMSEMETIQKALDSAFQLKMGENLQGAFTKKILDIHGKLVENSAVDLGHFRNRWAFKIRKNYQGAMLHGLIYNDAPYAAPLVYGGRRGSRPWPSTGPKTVEVSGRIHSRQTPFNLIDKVLSEANFNEITDLFVDTLQNLL